MSYNSDYLSPIKYIGGGGGNHLWCLLTADNAAAVKAADYITDAKAKKMTVGDPVLVIGMGTLPATSPAGQSLMYVSAIDADGNGTLNNTALA